MAAKKLFNCGVSTHRFKDNPLERRVAEEWDRINKPPGEAGVQTLEHLLTTRRDRRPDFVEPEDREKAATIIQWLGSPIGQNFLSDCGFITPERWERIRKDLGRAIRVKDFGMVEFVLKKQENNEY